MEYFGIKIDFSIVEGLVLIPVSEYNIFCLTDAETIFIILTKSQLLQNRV